MRSLGSRVGENTVVLLHSGGPIRMWISISQPTKLIVNLEGNTINKESLSGSEQRPYKKKKVPEQIGSESRMTHWIGIFLLQQRHFFTISTRDQHKNHWLIHKSSPLLSLTLPSLDASDKEWLSSQQIWSDDLHGFSVPVDKRSQWYHKKSMALLSDLKHDNMVWFDRIKEKELEEGIDMQPGVIHHCITCDVLASTWTQFYTDHHNLWVRISLMYYSIFS